MKQILIVYFLALPFQLVKPLGWTVIFVTLVTTFALFGADAIGNLTLYFTVLSDLAASEIEDPFGTDQVIVMDSV